MMTRRNLKPLTLLLILLPSVAVAGADAQYGFFGRTNDSTAAAQSEGCTGFGCPEDNSRDDYNYDSNTCTPVSLDLMTDGEPEDISFELICNDAPVWTYPSNLMPLRGANNIISLSACVYLQHACCHFALHDSHGDGLEEGDSASMELKVNSQTVLHYNNQVDPPFTTLAKSFGNTCQAPETVNVTPKDQPQELSCPMGKERPLHFKITLDEHPEDLSWYLLCNDNLHNTMVTVWDVPRGSLAGHVGQVAQESACIPYASTCAFNIIDAQGDGLITEGSGYTLTLGVSLLDVYMGSDDTNPFFDKSYCIGEKCGKTFDNDASTCCHDDEEGAREHYQKEIEQLQAQEQQEEAVLQDLHEESVQRQQELEQLEAELQQPPPPPQEPSPPIGQTIAAQDAPSHEEEDELEDLLHEEIAILQQEQQDEESKERWGFASLAVVGLLLLLLAAASYYYKPVAGTSAAARAALSSPSTLKPHNDNMDGNSDLTTEPSKDEEEGTFVLDS